jgi:peptidoglycan/xylan/chitin deacetylase (PgdA/CDA1 family)
MIPQRVSAIGLSGGRYSSPTSVDLKLRRWRKKLRVLLRPNALNMLGRRWATTTAQRLTRSTTDVATGCVILAYHRVTKLNTDPQMLAVTPSNFSAQLSVLRRHFNVIPLTELTRRLNAGESLSGTVALTFDDGYADNLFEAKPLLERYAAPATIFIASNHIDAPTEFWWDELERLLLQPGALPRTLHLKVGDRDYAWDLGDDAHYSETNFENNRTWTVMKPDTVTRRHQLYRALHGLLGLLDIAQRESILDSLRVWAGKERRGRASHRTLTKAEAIVLASGGLVEIGAHTANHPVLSMLNANAQEAEIRQSKQRLVEILGKAVTSFAYPYGSLTDYGGETVKLVKGMDFDCACSTFTDVVRANSDRFQLPRFMVRDWNGEEFARRMQMWMRR